MSLPPGGGEQASSGSGGPVSGEGEPREGSRETQDGLIISEAWDWCRSNASPVPYPITAKQIQAGNLANTVRQTNDKSHVRGSIVDRCEGDEGGQGGGIHSGTHNGACWPKTWSETVRFEDRNAVRHDDEWWMNNGNTWGRLHYIKDPKSYGSVQVATIGPLMGVDSEGDSGALTPSARTTDGLNSSQALTPTGKAAFDRAFLKPTPIPNAESKARSRTIIS